MNSGTDLIRPGVNYYNYQTGVEGRAFAVTGTGIAYRPSIPGAARAGLARLDARL